eukprot:TRINITY_DN11846_c0_g2_i1.p1 TRINITY_DN11846_c0_g2~~TRINITY_DN11846_c0_g2_i1.p1  ORF type:complete len:203 (+),score=24.91 TRINITY_DN11846_c0_g2_i1:92-700(+)
MSQENKAESMPAEQLYELCVKNGFFDFDPVSVPRRNSAPDILLSTYGPDVCQQEPSMQTSSVAEAQVSATVTTVPASDTHRQVSEHSQSFKTLMLRDVPCKVNVELMELTLATLGFADTYDYVHFPTKKTGSNLGFGFVNFMKETDADRFEVAFTGYKFPGISSSKQCYITVAEVQGREANLQLNARSSARSSASSSSSARV